MEKGGKIVIASIICMGCILLAFLFLEYPTFDRLLKSFITRNPERIGNFNPINSVLEEKHESPCVPISSQIPENRGEIFYSTVGMHDGLFLYTLHDVKIYKSVEVAGISVQECTQHFAEDESLQKQKFVVLDMSIKNQSESPGPYDDPDFPYVIDLWPMYKNIEISGNTGAYGCYFSNHPLQSSASTNYFHFALEIGEEMDFQYGISVPDELLEKQAFVMCLGSYEDEQYFNIFDREFTGEIKS